MDQAGALPLRGQIGPVDPARQGGGRDAQQSECDQAACSAALTGEEVEQGGAGPAADRDLDEGGMEPVPEPVPAQGVPEGSRAVAVVARRTSATSGSSCVNPSSASRALRTGRSPGTSAAVATAIVSMASA
ncbi:hypothetical protein DN069_35705 [Streptacidiphilus pinicola]|uniref:Uncharacterized protein n=1 Tax=Streptacidiphilus pinicola TaxID=2219663 RepID=A0A2X0J0R5_9ACTN|nr:hypothetical protein DN069_35705 [Streptacidiphilus pinicola]